MADAPSISRNLALWDAVKTTDPKYTRQFKRSGGFAGTAINQVYQIRKATELWGPFGNRWGVEVLNEKMLTGAPLRLKNGEAVAGNELVHQVNILLFYPTGNGDAVGRVPAVGVTTFVGVNSHGVYTDEEAPKKSLTDALGKALSWLGFAADVFTGLYEDSKYVNDLRSPPISPTSEALPDVDQITIARVLSSVIDMYDAAQQGEDMDYPLHETLANLGQDEKLALWQSLKERSKIRAWIKKAEEKWRDTNRQLHVAVE